MTELYVGNLLYEVTVEEVRALVEPFGVIDTIDMNGTVHAVGRRNGYGEANSI